MGRYTDYAPIGNTCPTIDKIISHLNSIHIEDDNDSNELSKALGLLEKVRSDNETLRGWGNDEFREKEDLEKENSELNEKVNDLESSISNLEIEISSLEDEVRHLEDQLENVN